MDSITHIAIGACLGEAIAGKAAGRKAMLWGAIAHSLPDIDVVCTAWMDTTSSLLAHRGITHSVLFVVMIAPFLALMVSRFSKLPTASFRRWVLLFTVAAGLHILLDAFNNYGVAWWEPFNHQRVSFNALYVVDPFFSFGPLFALIGLLLIRRPASRQRCWRLGLSCSLVYLLIAIVNKALVNAFVHQQLQQQQLPNAAVFTTPAPLQSFLWYVVVRSDSGCYTGYRSVLDKGHSLPLQYFPVHEHLLQTFSRQTQVAQLKRFSQGWYTVEKWGDSTVFNDLRFGQINGWQNPQGKFAFHYFLDAGADNRTVVQRGRLAEWNGEALQSLLRRIIGH